MRRNRKPHIVISGKAPGRGELIVLAGTFFIGSLLGCLGTGRISETEEMAIISYVEEYLFAAKQGRLTSPGLISVLAQTLRWPFGVVLFSCTAIGLFAIPVMFAIRGFLLSAAVSTLIKVLGSDGMVLAVLLFGITGLLSIPVFFLMGSCGMIASAASLSGLSGHKSLYFARQKNMLGVYIACLAILILCAVLEQTIVLSALLVMAETVL